MLDESFNISVMLCRSILTIILCFILVPSYAGQKTANGISSTLKGGTPALLVYYGKMTTNSLGEILRIKINDGHASLYSIEGEYRLPENFTGSQYFQPIARHFGAAMNMTYQNDPVGPVFEFNPYMFIEWQPFPWQPYLPTTLRFGEGLSYASQVPLRERRESDSNDTKRLLNLLILEASVSWPSLPQWQWIFRYHHRSGVFGLYGARNNGSTAIGVGLRYRFIGH